MLVSLGESSHAAQRTDPSFYQVRIAKEVQPFLSNCSSLFSDANGIFDREGVATCRSTQTEFANEYYDALEGDEDDKSDIGFMFQRGDSHGVKYNQTMACAWWIEADDTGGGLPDNPFDAVLADMCRQSADAVDEAHILEAEENRISNLTY